VPKIPHKPLKRSKLGFKRKEQKKPKRTLVWRIGQCPMHQGRSTPTLHLWVSGQSLCYNSPDYPVGHRTVQWVKWSNGCSATVDSNGHLQKRYSARTVRAESEQRQKAHRTVNSACLVRHRTVRCSKLSELQQSKLSEP
jgi:hypothetical protein